MRLTQLRSRIIDTAIITNVIHVETVSRRSFRIASDLCSSTAEPMPSRLIHA
jgi:hypothetical protein